MNSLKGSVNESVFVEIAEEKLTILLEFLLTEWSQKVRNDFLNKLKAKVNQTSTQPESCIFLRISL